MSEKKPGRLTIEAYIRRLLAIRPRSRWELEMRLKRRGYPEDAIRETLQRLEEGGLLDDASFAREWAESRMRRGKGPDAIVKELIYRFGVDVHLARTVVEEVYNPEEGYNQARKCLEGWWSRLSHQPRGRAKLFERARRRGIPTAWVERFLQEEEHKRWG